MGPSALMLTHYSPRLLRIDRARRDPRLGDLVVLRFFGGLTVEEAAEVGWLVSSNGQARLVADAGMAFPLAAASRHRPMTAGRPLL